MLFYIRSDELPTKEVPKTFSDDYLQCKKIKENTVQIVNLLTSLNEAPCRLGQKLLPE